MLQTWKNVLLRPGEEVFEDEKASPNATLGTALLWILSGDLHWVGLSWWDSLGQCRGQL